MTQVLLGENEGIDSALRRFKRQVSKAGILADVKYHRHFETPHDILERGIFTDLPLCLLCSISR